MKYEFFGILDKSKKDIFTLDNIEEIQKDFIKEAEEKILQNIIEKENDYIKIQQKNFNKRIENDDFKRGILYYYIDGYSSNNFNDLFVKGKTPEDFKKELLKGKCVEAASSDAARIKELEEKVLHLEIENAFLKELRRLRLEEEMKKSQESSAVSEENTD